MDQNAIITNPFQALDERLKSIEAALNDLSRRWPTAGDNDPEAIGGIDLAVQVTGLAKPTIYGLARQNRIPNFKRGGRLYFSKKDLISWITSARRIVLEQMV